MPDFKLIVNVGSASYDSVSVRVNYRINQVATASITLFPNTYSELSEVRKKTLPGEKIEISLDNKALFSGSVIRQTSDFSQANKIFLEASHDLQKSKLNYRSELYTNQSDEQILRKILQSHGVPLGTVDGMKFIHEQMVQVNCSDWRFIRTRLNACGVLLVSTPTGLKVIKPKTPVAAITLTQDSQDLLSASVESFNGMLAAGLEASSWDIDRQAMRTRIKANEVSTGTDTYDSKKLKSLTNTPWQQGFSRALQQDELQQLVDGRLLLNRLAALRGAFTIVGDVRAEPGKGLKIDNYGEWLDGIALITAVQHQFEGPDSGIEPWLTTIEVGSDLIAGMDSELVPSVYGLHIGIVDDNPQGPDKDHALKIRLPAFQLANNATLKARLGVPFASNESGFNFYPQKGDEVAVAFFEDDPRFPMIVGAMHNPKNKAPKAALDNGIGMVLKTGDLTQRLLLHPTEGLLLEEEKGAKKSSLTLKEGAANLVASDSVKVDTNNLDLNAKAKSTLVGSSGVEIKGSSVALKQ